MKKVILFVYLIFILSEIVTRSFVFGREVDFGDALKLTPLIDKGNTEEARNKSKVNLGGIESYSGYLTVNEQFDSNLFFWFFPANTTSLKSDLFLWIDGIADHSVFNSLFIENGPFQIKSHNSLTRRLKSWNEFNHILYIDSPVGIGFSFTSNGYSENATQVAKELYIALLQFFKIFPEYKENRFFIAGRWLAGKYLPELASIIDAKNNLNGNINNEEEIINLHGLIMGNALSDPEKQIKYGEYLYQLGFINVTEKKIFMEQESKFRRKIRQGRYDRAYRMFKEMIILHNSMFREYTKLYEYNYYNYNYRSYKTFLLEYDLKLLITSKAVKSAIHVGRNTFGCFFDVLDSMKNDTMKSVAKIVLNLLKKYRIYYYSGQSSIITNYPSTMEYINSLKYLDNTKTQRTFNQTSGVYSLAYGNLFVDLVLGAGHMTTYDNPDYMYEKIKNL